MDAWEYEKTIVFLANECRRLRGCYELTQRELTEATAKLKALEAK